MMTYNERTWQYDTTCESCGETTSYKTPSVAELYKIHCLFCQKYPFIKRKHRGKFDATCKTCGKTRSYKTPSVANLYVTQCRYCQKYPFLKSNEQGQWTYPCPTCGRTKTFRTRALAVVSSKNTTSCYTCAAKLKGIVHRQRAIKRHNKGGIQVHADKVFVSCAECKTSFAYGDIQSAKYAVQHKRLCPKCQRKKASVNYTDPTELWKPIPGFDYEVSDQGRVRNSLNWRLLIPQRIGVGRAYRTVTLFKNKQYNQKYIHHLVINAFGNPPPVGNRVPLVRHRDGDTANNVISNLYWSTNIVPQEGSVTSKILEALKTGPKSSPQLKTIVGNVPKGLSTRLWDLTVDKVVKRRKKPCPITNKRCYHYTLN